jgi:hypothetical protein
MRREPVVLVLIYSIRKPGSQEIEFFMVSWIPHQPVMVVRVV